MHTTSTNPDRRVSVVVPCYNRAAYVNVLLRSLTWSSVPPHEFEVIVVNDGGVDHIELVVEAWQRHGLDVRLLQLRAGGEPRNNAIARNAGLREARYPLVLQTDSDSVFVSDVLQRLRDTLKPGTFCSSSEYYALTRESTQQLVFGVEGPSESAQAYVEHAHGRPNRVLAPDGVGALHGAFGCTKDDLLRIGGYDESFTRWGWEDRELLVTLTHDARLTRRYMPDTPVVHLWHPPLRGETPREELAARGQISRAAWDVQMQRTAAEYPRTQRPRSHSPRALHAGHQNVFESSAYSEWTNPEGPSDGTRPLLYQMFFDAFRLEAIQLRALGLTSLARDVLRRALGRDWEQHPLELRLYDRVELVLEELILCEEELGDLSARDAALQELERWPGGQAIAAATRARTALRYGNLDVAGRDAAHLHGIAWTARRAALAIEIALLTGRPEHALDIAAAATATDDGCGDYFEQLRLAAYCRLLERLVPNPSAARPTDRLAHANEDRSEFLFSSAMRSLKDGLDIAVCVLLDVFLRSERAGEQRLYEEAGRHLDAARRRIARHVAPYPVDDLLAAFDHAAA